jgi:hypothetical protein
MSGSISPPLDQVQITLTYTLPDGTIVTRGAVTSAGGTFADTYAPEKEGQWSVRASWSGNENYLGAESPSAYFAVEQPFPTTYVTLGIVAIGIACLLFIVKIRRKQT